MEEIDDTILDSMFKLTLNERLLTNNDFIENKIDVVKNLIDCYKTEQNSLMLLKSNLGIVSSILNVKPTLNLALVQSF